MAEFKCRFIDEYYNFKVRSTKGNSMINPGIKAEILRRMENAMKNVRRGMICVDEFMRLLSFDCCQEDEDMGQYAVDGWEPFSDV